VGGEVEAGEHEEADVKRKKNQVPWMGVGIQYGKGFIDVISSLEALDPEFVLKKFRDRRHLLRDMDKRCRLVLVMARTMDLTVKQLRELSNPASVEVAALIEKWGKEELAMAAVKQALEEVREPKRKRKTGLCKRRGCSGVVVDERRLCVEHLTPEAEREEHVVEETERWEKR
jgi:hypothetical protein